jgi:hypothetical protein
MLSDGPSNMNTKQGVRLLKDLLAR